MTNELVYRRWSQTRLQRPNLRAIMARVVYPHVELVAFFFRLYAQALPQEVRSKFRNHHAPNCNFPLRGKYRVDDPVRGVLLFGT